MRKILFQIRCDRRGHLEAVNEAEQARPVSAQPGEFDYRDHLDGSSMRGSSDRQARR